MTNQTVLHAAHVAHGAKMVDFAGWDMPVNYGSQLADHHAVRRAAGMFAVTHMTIIDVLGEHGGNVGPVRRAILFWSNWKETTPRVRLRIDLPSA